MTIKITIMSSSLTKTAEFVIIIMIYCKIKAGVFINFPLGKEIPYDQFRQSVYELYA